MKKLLLLLLPAALFLTSCGDDDTADFSVSCTYLNIQEGSKFTYKYNTNNNVTTVETEVTSQEEIDGVTLAVFETEGENGGTSYLSCEGDKFISSAPSQSTNTGIFTSTTDPIILTYDLGAAVGEESLVGEIVTTSTAGGQSYTTTNKYFGTVTEKDITMEVEGKSYSDVVNYELRTVTETSLAPGQELEVVKTIYYFAPEVANIMTEIIDVTTNTVLVTATLEDFEY